jgi:hypothetical protein
MQTCNKCCLALHAEAGLESCCQVHCAALDRLERVVSALTACFKAVKASNNWLELNKIDSSSNSSGSWPAVAVAAAHCQNRLYMGDQKNKSMRVEFHRQQGNISL